MVFEGRMHLGPPGQRALSERCLPSEEAKAFLRKGKRESLSERIIACLRAGIYAFFQGGGVRINNLSERVSVWLESQKERRRFNSSNNLSHERLAFARILLIPLTIPEGLVEKFAQMIVDIQNERKGNIVVVDDFSEELELSVSVFNSDAVVGEINQKRVLK